MAHTKSVWNQSVRLHSLQSVDGVSWDQLHHEVCISRMWKSVLPSVQMRHLMLWLHKWTHMQTPAQSPFNKRSHHKDWYRSSGQHRDGGQHRSSGQHRNSTISSTAKKQNVIFRFDIVLHYSVHSHYTTLYTTGTQAQLEITKSLLNKLQATLTDENYALNSVLPHVNSLLRSAASAFEAAIELKENSTLPFLNKETVAAGKKMELQPRFTATTSGPGRKNKKNTLW